MNIAFNSIKDLTVGQINDLTEANYEAAETRAKEEGGIEYD